MTTQAGTILVLSGCGRATAPATPASIGLNFRQQRACAASQGNADCHRENLPFRSARRLLTAQGISIPFMPDDT